MVKANLWLRIKTFVRKKMVIDIKCEPFLK